GGAIFSVTGKRSSQIPQEAVIGISYVVAAAAAVLLLSRAAEGDEEIKNMLVGNILLVTPYEVWKCFALFVAFGVFHFILRRLLIGWVIAWVGGIAGLFFSFWWDLPSGAAIVCTFSALLILISFIGLWRRRGLML